MKGPVSALVLAAGQSKRMGVPKLLLPFGGRTMIGCTLENVVNSTVEEVLVITGYEAKKITEAVRGTRARVVINRSYAQGMLTSVIAGVKAVGQGTEAVMLIPGDQPMIRSTTIDTVLKAFRESEKGIAVPVYQGRTGHPTILSLKYRDELFELKDEGARRVVYQHPEDVLEVPVDSPEIIADIDTMDDYGRYRDFNPGTR